MNNRPVILAFAVVSILGARASAQMKIAPMNAAVSGGAAAAAAAGARMSGTSPALTVGATANPAPLASAPSALAAAPAAQASPSAFAPSAAVISERTSASPGASRGTAKVLAGSASRAFAALSDPPASRASDAQAKAISDGAFDNSVTRPQFEAQVQAGNPKAAAPANGTLRGRVKWFNEMRGYGFITPDNGGQDVFIRWENVETKPGEITLAEGQSVEFEIRYPEDPSKGPYAVNVRKAASRASDAQAKTIVRAPVELHRGRVLWFDEIKGYGFIAQDDSYQAIFVNRKYVETKAGEVTRLAKGQAVEYEIRYREDQMQEPYAVNVRPVASKGS